MNLRMSVGTDWTKAIAACFFVAKGDKEEGALRLTGAAMGLALDEVA
jgi:hypothetical protein